MYRRTILKRVGECRTKYRVEERRTKYRIEERRTKYRTVVVLFAEKELRTEFRRKCQRSVRRKRGPRAQIVFGTVEYSLVCLALIVASVLSHDLETRREVSSKVSRIHRVIRRREISHEIVVEKYRRDAESSSRCSSGQFKSSKSW